MLSELIIIGNEILSGRTRDSNGNFLASLFYQNHITLGKLSVIRDDKDEIINAINTAKKRSNIVITSGGLGPTKDDITKLSIAKVFNKKIKMSETCSEIVKKNYEQFEREWNSQLNNYHYLH